jgi:hypothetical protein
MLYYGQRLCSAGIMEIRTPSALGELPYTKCLGSSYFSNALLLGLYPTRNTTQNWRKPGKLGRGAL